MATPQIHVRSISLPLRLDPTAFEVEVQNLKSWQISSIPITSEGIQSGLLGLPELYSAVEELIKKSPNATHQNVKSMEDSLSESTELLDSCSVIRELFQMIKENIQSLQSALRRKGMSDPSIQNDITTYFRFRKKMTKGLGRTLKTLKNLEHKIGSDHAINAERNSTGVLRQVTEITIATLKSTLVFLSLPTGICPRGWSFVSKLMLTKSGRENGVISEVGDVDFALKTIQGKLRSSGAKVVDEVQILWKTLQNVEAIIQGFEEGLERLNRQLVQSRVILLNVLTDH